MAVLAALVVTGAHAADTSFTDMTKSEMVNGSAVSNALVENSGRVDAAVRNATASTTVTGTQQGNSASVTANTIAASATGNDFVKNIDLSLTGSNSNTKGVVTLGRASNTGVVSSTVDSNALNAVLTGATDGTVVNKDNTISATTVVNRGVSTVAGTVPNNYTSSTGGTTGIASSDGLKTFTATASIVSTSAQQTINAASTATASSNGVKLDLTASNSGTVASSAALTGNTISSSISGNSAASTLAIQSGGAPAFTGSAVLGNTQLGSGSKATASNTDSLISSSVAGASPSTSTLTGTLAVTGNTISSSAIGNEALGTASGAGNRILLGDGLSFTGRGADTPSANLTGYAGGTALNAGLLIVSTQSNLNTAVAATTSGGKVSAVIENLTKGAVDLSANSIKADATGNAASSALASGANTASFSGSAAVANQQSNANAGVSATNTGADLYANTADVANGTVSLTKNSVSANARGNEIGQSMALDATTLSLGTAAATLTDSAIGILNAVGAATVSNLQTNTGAPVAATVSNSTIRLATQAVANATLALSSNTQEAVALANNAGNALSLNGTSVGTGAGIASTQQVAGDSAVQATLTNNAISINIQPSAQGVSGSTLAVANNLQRAVGYGNQATNDLRVTATTVSSDLTSNPASMVNNNSSASKKLTGTVAAGYGILNDQSVLSAVGASATSSGAATIGTKTVDRSQVLNEGNTFAAVADGNNATSRLTLNSTGISSNSDNNQAFSSIANIISTQAANAAITAIASPGMVAQTKVNGDVTASTVSASRNSLQSVATGSLSSNALNVAAESVATSDKARTGSSNFFDFQKTTASFSLQNVQSGQGSVKASQLTAPMPSDVQIAVSGKVINTTLVADANTSAASATSNSTTNVVKLTAGSLASSSALQNVQTTSAGVTAEIGVAGTPGSPGADAIAYRKEGGISDPLPTNSGSFSTENILTVSAGKSILFRLKEQPGMSKTDLEAYLTNQGLTIDTANSTATASGYAQSARTFDFSGFTKARQDRDGDRVEYSFSGYTKPAVVATPAMPNRGGVTLTVSGNSIDNAQLSVSNNSTIGFATGNRASNNLSLQGNKIAAGSILRSANTRMFAFGKLFADISALADHTVSNNQAATASAIASNVYGTLAIDTAPTTAITGSSLKVSNNSQSASAVGNTADNSLVLKGNSVTAVSALQSVQQGTAAVSAVSNLELYVPGGVTNSSVLVSGNSNSSLAVVNDVTNMLNVSGNQVGNNGAGTSRANSFGPFYTSNANAENVLSNSQIVTSTVDSTAITQLYNKEAYAASSKGSSNSSLTLSGNITAAEASANRALNTASVTGTASQAASVAVGNNQLSFANVTASATTTANVGMTSNVLNSTTLIDANSTTALARGNTATNVLNSLADSAYGTASGGTVGSSVSANAGVLNAQTNSGAVSATSTGAIYKVALNTAGNVDNAGSVGNVGVTGNQVTAQAYGNSATNTMTLNALNTNMPTAAIGNYQSNTGSVTATVSSVTYGVGITGGVNSSTLRTQGNQITATAVGNSVTSSILAAR